jgi:hypothetical protein
MSAALKQGSIPEQALLASVSGNSRLVLSDEVEA